MSKSRANYINMVQVKRGKYVYFRARLTLQPRQPPIDFFGKTAAEADAKRKAYIPVKKTLDKKTRLIDYINNTFIPDEELRVQGGSISYVLFIGRRGRLKNFLNISNMRFIPLGKLVPEDMIEFFKELIRHNVSAENRQQLKVDLGLVLKSARKYILNSPRDYFEDIKVPKPQRGEKPVFDIAKIQDCMFNPKYKLMQRAIIAFEFFIQCRPSELFALTWDDVDLESGMVRINKAIRRTKLGDRVTPGTKTSLKGREGEMHPALVDMLREIKRSSQGQERVFLTNLNRPLDNSAWRHMWSRMRKEMDLPDGPDFYSLKHLGNSYAIENGVDVSLQKKKMGHSPNSQLATTTYRVIGKTEMAKTTTVFDALVPNKSLPVLGANSGTNT